MCECIFDVLCNMLCYIICCKCCQEDEKKEEKNKMIEKPAEIEMVIPSPPANHLTYLKDDVNI